MPQCLPRCGERSLGSRTPRLANPKPRHCLHGTQSTRVWTQLRYVTWNLAKQCLPPTPRVFHCTRDPIFRPKLWEGKERNAYSTNDPSEWRPWAGVERMAHSVVSVQPRGVCVYIYIYIYCILPSFKTLYWWPNGDCKLQKHEANSK